MPDITVTIPHQLSRADAKRRIQEGLGQSRQQFGHLIGPIEEHWEGDKVDLKITAAGQVLTGRATVSDQDVRVTIAVPWMLSMLAGTIRRSIEQQGRQLLGQREQPLRPQRVSDGWSAPVADAPDSEELCSSCFRSGRYSPRCAFSTFCSAK